MVNQMDINTREERLLDALLNVAVKEALQKELDMIMNGEGMEQYDFDTETKERLNQRVYATVAKGRRAYRRKKALQITRWFAVGFAVVLFVSISIIMSIEASRTYIRNYVRNLVIEIRDDHVTFGFEYQDTDGDGNSFSQRLLESLPTGFGLINSQVSDELAVFYISDRRGNYIDVVWHMDIGIDLALDNELRVVTQQTVNGQDVYLFEAHDANELHMAMWQYGDDVVIIYTNVDIEELMLFIRLLVQ